ncbi:MAG TPA: hypothetical protein VLA36_15715 [Longimicrobiales bacterium]|nr:hypothetical protein [Longimicrobiales bacterium]
MTGTRLFVTAAAMGGVLAIAACEGENLFSVPGGAGGVGGADSEAPVVSITVPRGDSLSAKPVGDSVFVTAHVTDDVGIRSIRMYGVARRGVDTLGTSTVVQRFEEKSITVGAGIKDTTVYRYLLATSDTTKETAIIIVEAMDTLGNMAADSVDLILGGPDVVLVNVQNGLAITAGGQLNVGVQARDPLGITVVTLKLSGAYSAAVEWRPSPAVDSFAVDTVLSVPPTASGPLTVSAVARNALEVAGQSPTVTMNVVAAGAGDTIAPSLMHSSSAPARMEIQDSVRLSITGSDNTQGSGIASVGYTVLGISPTRGDTLLRSDFVEYSPALTGTVSASFGFGTFNVDSLNLPDSLVYELTTWMRDDDGNCAAATGQDQLTSFPCVRLASGETLAQDRAGQRIVRTVVAGKTVRLPAGGRILDAAVDTARKNLYLSNITNNRLEVFNLQTELFSKAIGVGSEPWGLAFSRNNDSLWVANSGGTNLSVVDLAAGREVDNARFLTPDVVLFEVEVRTSDGGIQLLVREYPQAQGPSFSDRPQYVAVDSFGNLVYSTKTSEVGNLGTVRKGYFENGWSRSEAKLFIEHGELTPSEDFYSIAHIDSIQSSTDTLGVDSLGNVLTAASLALFDHVPGFPNQIIKGTTVGIGIPAIDSALTQLRNGGSDVFAASAARWNIPSLTFQDTTYVAASGDGGWVAVGEGGAAPVGRVLSYGARPLESTSLSRSLQVADLLTNPAEEVRGIGLNYDGTLGVVRGRFAAYFFSPPDLRLQGLTEIPVPETGAGATLHPLHADFRTLDNLGGGYSPDTHIAFVASGEHTVDIIDTQRYTRIGRVYIRDVITGPLRAVLPFPVDNAGFVCSTVAVQDKRGNFIGNAVRLYEAGNFLQPIAPDGTTEDRCVVMKLFATTSGGGVVVIDVRKADVLKEHPERR